MLLCAVDRWPIFRPVMLVVVRGTKRTRYEMSSHRCGVQCRCICLLYFYFTVLCWARCYLVILFCVISFQGSFSYSNCACVTKTGKTTGEAKKGTCDVDCGLNFVLFLTLLALFPFLMFLNDTPATIVTLRFVKHTSIVQQTFTLIISCLNVLLIYQFYSLYKRNHNREGVLLISIWS